MRWTERLRVPNPEHARRERLGLWTGGIPRDLFYLHSTEDGLWIPRGCLPGPIVAPVLTQDAPEPPLRPYQARVVDQAHAERQGLIVAPCGAGKTRIGLALAHRSRQRTVVVVHTRDLHSQWESEVCALGLSCIVIRTVQSLVRDADLAQYLGGFGCLILDECHHAPASTFSQVLDLAPCAYRYGLTATPDRTDGLGQIMPWYFGGTFEVTAAELREAGATVRAEIEMRRTGFAPQGADYGEIIESLVGDAGRLALIVGDIVAAAASGRRCLVLSSRVAYAESLAVELHRAGVAVELAHGGTPDRAGALERMRTGASKVLVATTIADEGLDLPSLDRVFIALPSRAPGRAIQRLGRILRPSPGKTGAVLVDYVDDHGILRSQAASRGRAYRRALA